MVQRLVVWHCYPYTVRCCCVLTGMKLSSTELVFRSTNVELLAQNMGLVLAGAVLAFFLEFSEFLLVSNTSSLTLSIAGIFKVSGCPACPVFPSVLHKQAYFQRVQSFPLCSKCLFQHVLSLSLKQVYFSACSVFSSL